MFFGRHAGLPHRFLAGLLAFQQGCRQRVWLSCLSGSLLTCKHVCRPTCRLAVRLSGWTSDIPASLPVIHLAFLLAWKHVCRPTCKLAVWLSGWTSDIPESLREVQLTCLFAGLLSIRPSALHAGFRQNHLFGLHALQHVFWKACLQTNGVSSSPTEKLASHGASGNEGMRSDGQIWTRRASSCLRHPCGRPSRNSSTWAIVVASGIGRRGVRGKGETWRRHIVAVGLPKLDAELLHTCDPQSARRTGLADEREPMLPTRLCLSLDRDYEAPLVPATGTAPDFGRRQRLPGPEPGPVENASCPRRKNRGTMFS